MTYPNQELFYEAIKKAYESGKNEEITIKKIIEDLKIDLKNIVKD